MNRHVVTQSAGWLIGMALALSACTSAGGEASEAERDRGAIGAGARAAPENERARDRVTTTTRSPSEPGRGITVRNHGIGLTLPSGWDGRIVEQRRGELPVAHAASFALPADDAKLDVGKAASRMMGAEDLRVVLMEVGNQVGTQGFEPARLPIRISRSDLRSSPSPFVLRHHAVAGRRFAIHGRPFSLLVEFGRKPPTALQLKQANRVVASLEIDPRAELDPAQWKPLRRPLQLPSIRAGAACPRASSTRTGTGTTWPLGPGPAYPALGLNGVASLKDDLVKRGWYLYKTLWAISPRYRGPVLIRGGRVDGSGVLRFNFRLAREFRLHKLAPTAPSRWRHAPSHTALRGAGCYAFQVDGIGFSRVVVFAAETR